MSQRDFSWVKNVDLEKAFSTFDRYSSRAKVGLEAERVVREYLRGLIDDNNLQISVQSWENRSGHLCATEKERAINNSIEGDLLIYELDGDLKRTVEVKSSSNHPNVTFKTSTFDNSKAEFLIALTQGEMWCCTMDEARRAAKFIATDDRENGFWLVAQDLVSKVPIIEVLR